MAFLAANTPTPKGEGSTTDQFPSLTNPPNTPSGVIVDPANPAVPEGRFSAKGDLFRVTPQSLNTFNEYTSSFRPSPALPGGKRSGVLFHHNGQSSEEHSIVHLQMDLQHPQTSTTLGSQDHFVTANSLPPLPNDLSTIDLSKTDTVKGNNPNASPSQTGGNIQDGLNILPRLDNEELGRADKHNKGPVSFFFDSKGLTLSLPYNSDESNTDMSAEGSGSGSGLYSNRLNQEFDGVTTIKADQSTNENPTISFKVENAGKMSRSTGSRMESETADGADEGGKKEFETAAVKEMEESESELSGEEEEEMEGEGVHDTGNERVRKVDGETNESARQLNRTAGYDLLKEREAEVEAVLGKTISTETGSGDEIESNFRGFSWPEDVPGSGESGGDLADNGKGKGNKVSDGKEGIKPAGGKASGVKGDGREDNNKEVVSGRRDLRLYVRQGKPTTEFPLLDSSEEKGDDDDDKEGGNIRRTVWSNSTVEDSKDRESDAKRNGGLESLEHMERGGREGSDGAAVGESLQAFSSVDGLLFDAARSPVLGRLVPLLRLTDGSKATEEQTEGKCSSALLLCDRL